MRAARYHGPGHIEIQDVPEPEAGPGQVKVRVGFNGICGSDLHEYYDAPVMVPLDAPHARTGVLAPVILGHECGGTVEALGAGVDDLAPGTVVAIEPIDACHHCRQCDQGHVNHCENLAFHGFNTGGGGLAEFTVVERSMVHELPPGLDVRQAALVEPLAVAYRAVLRTRAEPGDWVAVHGAGPIGIGAALTLRHLGMQVVLVEPGPARREVARGLGFDHVLDPTVDRVASAIRALTGGSGVDATIDAAGAPPVLLTALRTTRPHGTVVLVAVPTQPVELPVTWMLGTEVDVRASTAYQGEFPLVIEAMAAGAYPLDGWVESIPLTDLITAGFERLRAGQAMKVLVDPTR